jgi:hypothetical protein
MNKGNYTGWANNYMGRELHRSCVEMEGVGNADPSSRREAMD